MCVMAEVMWTSIDVGFRRIASPPRSSTAELVLQLEEFTEKDLGRISRTMRAWQAREGAKVVQFWRASVVALVED